jgi:hypothetical protein
VNTKLILVLLSILIFGGCASFESAKTVGKIGATLTDYKPLNDNVAFLCESIQQTKGFTELPCDSLRSRYKTLNAGIDILASYSAVLLLAINDNDFTLSDLVGQVAGAGQSAKWLNANDDQIAGSKGIAAALQTLVVNGLKRKAIRETVRNVALPVDSVCLAMLSNINLQKQAYATYLAGVQVRYTVNSQFQKKLAGTDADQLATFNLNNDVLLLANKFARDEVDKLERAAKIIESFSISHRKLAEKSSLIGHNKDAQLQNEIIDSIKGIFSGIEAFKTPVSGN